MRHGGSDRNYMAILPNRSRPAPKPPRRSTAVVRRRPATRKPARKQRRRKKKSIWGKIAGFANKANKWLKKSKFVSKNLKNYAPGFMGAIAGDVASQAGYGRRRHKVRVRRRRRRGGALRLAGGCKKKRYH